MKTWLKDSVDWDFVSGEQLVFLLLLFAISAFLFFWEKPLIDADRERRHSTCEALLSRADAASDLLELEKIRLRLKAERC